jgi:hypothetical protein
MVNSNPHFRESLKKSRGCSAVLLAPFFCSMQTNSPEDKSTGSNSSPDLVRAHTSPEINRRIDQETIKRIWEYSSKARGDISRRIAELDREWDLERSLQVSSSTLILSGLLWGMAARRLALFLIPAAATASLLQHSIMGWSPQGIFFRRFGVRTRREIEAEKNALKMLRGDFDVIRSICEETHLAVEALKVSRV